MYNIDKLGGPGDELIFKILSPSIIINNSMSLLIINVIFFQQLEISYSSRHWWLFQTTSLLLLLKQQWSSVLSLFLDAVDSFGLPSRVRYDRGGENSLVGYYMLNHPLRGTGCGSIICGRSVHNQRFWRDLFTGCTSLFYHLFYHLDTGLFNSDDPVHLWCLHSIYRPYINSAIANFVDGWSCHPMSSTNGLSPRQLWMQGMLKNYNSGQGHRWDLWWSSW